MLTFGRVCIWSSINYSMNSIFVFVLWCIVSYVFILHSMWPQIQGVKIVTLTNDKTMTKNHVIFIRQHMSILLYQR